MWLFFGKRAFSLETRTATELGRKKQSDAKHSMGKNNVCENQELNLLLSSLFFFFFFSNTFVTDWF